MSLRAVVVDDSPVFRRVVTDALEKNGAKVVGFASNGREGLKFILALKPDLVTLDIEMPEMNGLQVLEALREAKCPARVIVVSGLTERASQLTVSALEKGAFDFIVKPSAETVEQNKTLVQEALRPAISLFLRQHESKPAIKLPVSPAKPAAAPPARKRPDFLRPELVVVGISTGGPKALMQLMPHIPKNIGVPILIVQHMPPMFTQTLAANLSSRCQIPVREAQHNEQALPGTAYIAPGGRQMRVAVGASAITLQITDDPPEHNCRPAVDYLFRSVAAQLPGRALGVIMTGMGHDGTLGLRLMKRHNSPVIAQDEASCVVYSMPRSAVEAGVVDYLLPLDLIAGHIIGLVQGDLK
jgi:two-component system chemotaxis response regulator CheB